jgi:predicted nucleic acid-binding Zn ribbon protein
MPLIEFKCECGQVIERLYEAHKAAKITQTLCACGKVAPRIIATPAPAQFKGAGFYATDYKGK